MKWNRRCAICGVEYEAKTWHQKYCSWKCAERAVYLKRASGTGHCENCGKEYSKLERGYSKYCSAECKAAGFRERRGGGKKQCAECGMAFEGYHVGDKYCSAECRKRARQRRRSVKQVRAFKPVVKRCVFCGERFIARTAFQVSRKRYCSGLCREYAYRERHPVRYRNRQRKWAAKYRQRSEYKLKRKMYQVFGVWRLPE